MENLLLFIISITLVLIFATMSIIVASIKIILGRSSSNYFFECALAIDILGNAMGQHIWNFIFIRKYGYQFGKRSETMSSALGKNQRDNTLITPGKIIVSILNFLEKDHCIISIRE